MSIERERERCLVWLRICFGFNLLLKSRDYWGLVGVFGVFVFQLKTKFFLKKINKE